MDGVLLINKKRGYTSRDIVNIVGKTFHTKKVGHTGTLDPMAEGLLVICVGKATKLVEVLTHDEKEYIAEVTLGMETDTLDLEGKLLKEETVEKTEEEIKNTLNNMIGTYLQEVPIFSAVKIDGKKLYEYARAGKKIELPKRKVTIKELELISPISYENGKTVFRIRTVVSKGTYIRALIKDIAASLNTIGVMSKLTRTRVGNFSLKESVTVENVEQTDLISIEEALKDYPKVVVSSMLEKQIRNGAILENTYSQLPIAFYNESGDLLALYKQYEKDITKIKPWKMF